MGRSRLAGRIKLLKLVTSFNIGGTERQVTNLALALNAERFDLHLACLKNTGAFLKDLEPLHVPQPEFRIGKLYSGTTLQQALRLGRYIRQNSIQIVHTYGFYPNVFALPVARMARRSIIIASIRDTGAHLTRAQLHVQKIACRLADCVLVNAQAIRCKLIAEGYDPQKISVIRNGIELPDQANSDERSAARAQLGLPARARVVAVFSRLTPSKGIDYFLDAASSVAKEFPDVYFMIVGDGEIRKQLEEHARWAGLAGRVIFTGFRRDVQRLLAQVSVSVLPSLSEGLSNVLLESMAAGIPVVATRVGGNPEAVADGITGLLVPPRDAVRLAEGIGALLKNPELAADFGRAARQRAADLFSVGRAIRETETLYQRLVETQPQRLPLFEAKGWISKFYW